MKPKCSICDKNATVNILGRPLCDKCKKHIMQDMMMTEAIASAELAGATNAKQ
ncbi:MAG: hypothetical protein GY861_13855 [bacterium]|nr:hypothetical protein [bacterium]